MNKGRPVLSGLCTLLISASLAFGAENDAAAVPPNATKTAASEPVPSTSDEIRELRKLLIEQQRQIDELRRSLQAQKEPPPAHAPALASPNSREPLGDVASTTPIIPGPVPATPAAPSAIGGAPQKSDLTAEPSPLSLRIGTTSITPIGFMDFTMVTRDVDAGTGIGTNFGSFPYRTKSSPQGNLSEFRFSPQNSRIGARFDALVKGANVLGYWESDFLGPIGNPPSGNVAVSTNSYPLRLRLFWVDLKKDKWEVLGGQTWTLLTPNRNGISPLPGDIFYGQAIDVNYLVGLAWGRIPEFRFVYRPTHVVSMAFALDSPEQYIGGSGGGGVVTLPSALATPYGTQLSNGTLTLNTPNLHPDILAKIAFDGKMSNGNAAHFEIAGLERTFKTYNPTTGESFTKAGGGFSVNLNLEVVKNFRLVTNNYYSYGGGRYLFGVAPDLVVGSNGSLSLIHSMGTASGIEYVHKNTLFDAYYGGLYVSRNVQIDTTGKAPVPVGYGYSGAPNSQNKSVQEFTASINQTLWKNPQYGALNVMFQYAYFTRNPWYLATGVPTNAYMNEFWINLRYTLPGSAPSLK
jgi:hypothetical protein